MFVGYDEMCKEISKMFVDFLKSLHEELLADVDLLFYTEKENKNGE